MLTMRIIALGVVLACTVRGSAATPPARPIIGLLTVPNFLQYPTEDAATLPFNAECWIPASYVKLIEAGGARVAPLPCTGSWADFTAVVQSVNGFLFGGLYTDYLYPNNTGAVVCSPRVDGFAAAVESRLALFVSCAQQQRRMASAASLSWIMSFNQISKASISRCLRFAWATWCELLVASSPLLGAAHSLTRSVHLSVRCGADDIILHQRCDGPL